MPFDRVWNELSARNGIVDIVSQYVQLKKKWRKLFRLSALSTDERLLLFLFLWVQQTFHRRPAVARAGA